MNDLYTDVIFKGFYQTYDESGSAQSNQATSPNRLGTNQQT
jgi:hypothetical protein